VSAPSCAAVGPVPETMQVAWVSELGDRLGANSMMEVVRVTDLRRLVEGLGRDPTRVLRALGLAKKRAKGRWKVTVFDVKRDWLCRPVEGAPGRDLAGVPTCEESWQRKGPGTYRASYSGCGYLLDTQAGTRTLDSYRLRWGTAVTWGFCVLPLERFLAGA
jgi:hypothetical protein